MQIRILAICLAIFLLILAPVLKAETELLSWSGFASVEDIDNFSGGIRTGTVFDVVGHIETSLDTAAAHLWQGGTFTAGLLAIAETHNQNLYTGAIQTISNLTAPNKILISDLTIHQVFNKTYDVWVGIMDTNHHFDIVDLASDLLNSSYGHCPIMTSNYPIATYPYPGFGAILGINFDLGRIQLGLFQGNPQHQDTVFHDGYAVYGEVTGDLPSAKFYDMNFKVGAWHYQQSNPDIGNTTSGGYILLEADWKNKAQQKRGVFLRFGIAPETINLVPYYLGGGFTADAIFASRPKDVFSLGFSTVWIKDLPAETIYEIAYAIYLTDHFTLNPDLQYVVKPSGIYPNAFGGILRLTYSF